MILVTVGAQMSFDRLVSAVDDWAGRTPGAEVFAQIGPAREPPRNVAWTRFLEPDEFRRRVAQADVVVSHAGMGTILTALEHGKPIVVMPRRGDLEETRNDHQVATAERFRELGAVYVARDAVELVAWLGKLSELRPGATIRACASAPLLESLRKFVLESGPPYPRS